MTRQAAQTRRGWYRSAVAFNFAAQGHGAQVIDRLRAALGAPNGILLATRPTTVEEVL